MEDEHLPSAARFNIGPEGKVLTTLVIGLEIAWDFGVRFCRQISGKENLGTTTAEYDLQYK